MSARAEGSSWDRNYRYDDHEDKSTIRVGFSDAIGESARFLLERYFASLEPKSPEDSDPEARFDSGIHTVSSELHAQPSLHHVSPRLANPRLQVKGRRDLHSTPIRSPHFHRRDPCHSLDLRADASHHRARDQGLLPRKRPYPDSWKQNFSGRDVGSRSVRDVYRADLHHPSRTARTPWRSSRPCILPYRREQVSLFEHRSPHVEGRRSPYVGRQGAAGKGLLPHPRTEYGYGSPGSRGPLLDMPLKSRRTPEDGHQGSQEESRSSWSKNVKDREHGKAGSLGSALGHSWASSGPSGPTQPKKSRLQEEMSQDDVSPYDNISETSRISFSSESLQSEIQNGKSNNCVMKKAFSDISQYSDHRQDGVLYGEGEGWNGEMGDRNVVASSNSLGGEKEGAQWETYSDITAVSEDQQLDKPCVRVPQFSDISSVSSEGAQEKTQGYVKEEQPPCRSTCSSSLSSHRKCSSFAEQPSYSDVTCVSPGQVSQGTSEIDGASDGHSRSGYAKAEGTTGEKRCIDGMSVKWEHEQHHFSDISSYTSDNATDQVLVKESKLSPVMTSELAQAPCMRETAEAVRGTSSWQTQKTFQTAAEESALIECKDRLGNQGETGREQDREDTGQTMYNTTRELEGEVPISESSSCSVQDALAVEKEQPSWDQCETGPTDSEHDSGSVRTEQDSRSNVGSEISCVLSADQDQEQESPPGRTVFPETPSCTGEDGDSGSSSEAAGSAFSCGEPEDVSVVPEMDTENCNSTQQSILSLDRQSDSDRQHCTDADVTVVEDVPSPPCQLEMKNTELRQEVDGDRNVFTSLFSLRLCSSCKQEKCSWDCCSAQSALKPASEATVDHGRTAGPSCPSSGHVAKKPNTSASAHPSNTFADQALQSKGVASFSPGTSENALNIKLVDRLKHLFKSPKVSKAVASPPCDSLPASVSTLKRSFSCPTRETEKGKASSFPSSSLAPQKSQREGVFAIDWNVKLSQDKTHSSSSGTSGLKKLQPSSRQKFEKLSLKKSRTEKTRTEKPRVRPAMEDVALSNLFKQMQISKAGGNPRIRTRQEYQPLLHSLACMVQHGLDGTEDHVPEEHIADSLDLLEEFSHMYRPSRHLLWKMVKVGILGSTHRKTLLRCEAVVRKLWERHPTSVFLDWEEVLLALKPASSSSILNQSVLVHTVISGLETELATHNLSNMQSIQRSLAYRFLGPDSYLSYLKTLYSHVTYWLANCQQLLQATQQSQAAVLVPPRPGGNASRQEAERVELTRRQMLLPGLFQLLELGVNVSQSCTRTAGRVAQEVVNNYIYLPDLERKRQLLELLSSPLLCFKVVQQILEKFCANTIKCCEEFPSHPVDVAQAFSASLPPCIPTTPPQSPLDPMEVEQEQPPAARFSAACVEELAMLAFYATKSYLTTIKGQLHQPMHLRRQTGRGPRPGPSCQGAVQHFWEHILSLHSEPTATTLGYLGSLEQLLLR